MKYQPTYDQVMIYDFGLKSEHGHLLDLIVHASTWCRYKVINNERYYLLDYSTLSAELPTVFGSKQAVGRVAEKLEKCSLISTIKSGRSKYFKAANEVSIHWLKNTKDTVEYQSFRKRNDPKTERSGGVSFRKRNGIVPKMEPIKQLNQETIIQQLEDRLFLFWKKTFNQPKAKLGDDRKKVITKALINYSVEELEKAIIGCSKSDWHVRNNHFHIGNIFKNSDQIEKFIGPQEFAGKKQVELPTSDMAIRQILNRLINQNQDPFTHPIISHIFTLAGAWLADKNSKKFSSKDEAIEFVIETYDRVIGEYR